MSRETRKRILLGVLALLVLAAVVYGFIPDAVPVQAAEVRRAPLQVTVEEEGETRVRNRYVVSSPVAAFARRIEVEVGDVVERGQPLVRLDAPRAGMLDPRSHSQAEARVASARARVTQAGVAAERAAADRERYERLTAGGAASIQALEQARAEAIRAEGELSAARAELAGAQAVLRATVLEGASGAPPAVLHAPTAGRVLAVHRRSEGAVAPGEPLVEIGDTERLEVRVDVLSEDAVRIGPGSRVLIDQWGGDSLLEGRVERVEPEGFTRVSSLGVEEKRVPVVAGITSPAAAWSRLGSGYRVLARFVLWEGDGVLQVPTSALFRNGEEWAVFVVEDGRAVRRPVQVGHQSGLVTQVIRGLREGERVIVHPGNEIEDGIRVDPE